MKFAKWTYWIAAIYGLLVVTPLYFSETQVGVDYPPAITHAEFFYGFIGVTLAWQLAFMIIGRDPLRYRPLMPVTVVEKLSYAMATILLYLQQRLASLYLVFGLIDLVLGVLFMLAYFQTGKRQNVESSK